MYTYYLLLTLQAVLADFQRSTGRNPTDAAEVLSQTNPNPYLY